MDLFYEKEGVGKFLKVPRVVGIAVTGECNLDCIYCLASSTRESRNLSTDEWLKLISYLGKIGTLQVIITGGEPFARRDILKIIECCARNKLLLSIVTNATLINSDLVNSLSGFSIFQFKIGIDGSKPEVHDPLRGEGSFKQCLKGIEHLKSLNTKLSGKVVLTKLNWQDLVNIVELTKGLGFEYIDLSPPLMTGNARLNAENLLLNEYEWEESVKIIKEYSKKDKGYIRGMIKRAMMKEDLIDKDVCMTKTMGCNGASTFCLVRNDGAVMPCPNIWDFVGESIRDKDFLEIWRESKSINSFREITRKGINGKEECKACHYNRLCSLGCVALRYTQKIRDETQIRPVQECRFFTRTI